MLLTVKDLQKLLSIGRDTAYSLMRAKGFPSIRIGRRYYVTQSELNKWLERYTYKTFDL